VRYLDGVLIYRTPALSFPGKGRSFSISLGYNNNPDGVLTTDFHCGVNWWLQGVPFIEQRPDGTLLLMWGATGKAEFAPAGAGKWVGLHGVSAQIVLQEDELDEGQPKETVYALKGLYGGRAYFHLLDHPELYMRGKVKRIITRAGKEINFSYNQNGPQEIVDTNENHWNFVYDNNTGRLQAIYVWHPPYPLGEMTFEYYTGLGRCGSTGDLKTVTITEYTSSGQTVSRTFFFAYYTTTDKAHLLRFILQAESYERAASKGIDFDNPYQVQSFADFEFDYSFQGSRGRFVAVEKVRNGGCGCTGNAVLGEYRFSYRFQPENSQDPYNNWVTEVTQTNPDGTVKIVRVNKIGSPIDVVLKKTVGGDTHRWAMHYVYDSQVGRLLAKCYPSACRVVGDNDQVEADQPGLVLRYSYESTWGAVETVGISQGLSGQLYVLKTYTYYPNLPGPWVKSVEVNVDRDGQEPFDTTLTSYQYSFYDNDSDPNNDSQLKLKTVILPAVPEAQNGSGAGGEIKECYHPETGALLWRQEKTSQGAYSLTVYQYNDLGLRVKQVRDPDSNTWNDMKTAMGLGSEVPNPDGYSTEPVIATTEWSYDERFFVEEEIGPSVQVDIATGDTRRLMRKFYRTKLSSGKLVKLSRTYEYSASSTTPLNPISITVLDLDRNVHETALGVPNGVDIEDCIDTTKADLNDAFNGWLFERRSFVYGGGRLVEEHLWSDPADPGLASHYVTKYEYPCVIG